jgi:hypothetical protein
LRYAGGLWSYGSESGVTLAVFTGAGLTADAMADFYEAGAKAAPDTHGLERRTIMRDSLGLTTAERLDLDNDGYLQTVISWSIGDDARVRVILVSSAARDVTDRAAHDAIVFDALAVFD